MIRTASTNDLPALRALFARANDTPYDLSAVAEEKCFGDGVAGPPHVSVFERNARLLGASVTCGKYLRILAVDRNARRQGIGTALLQDAESRGVSVIAAEAGNYFVPGVLQHDEAFFRARGYGAREATWNLTVILSAAKDPLRKSEGDPSPSAGLRMTVQRANDRDRVLAFIEREFGRIWRFESAKAFDVDPPNAFISEDDGEITGFAVHDVNNRGLGFFGPTGVAKSMRGRGIGCALLLASLNDLRRLGYARAVIPWTDALAFYEKCCGARPAHQFTGFVK